MEKNFVPLNSIYLHGEKIYLVLFTSVFLKWKESVTIHLNQDKSKEMSSSMMQQKEMIEYDEMNMMNEIDNADNNNTSTSSNSTRIFQVNIININVLNPELLLISSSFSLFCCPHILELWPSHTGTPSVLLNYLHSALVLLKEQKPSKMLSCESKYVFWIKIWHTVHSYSLNRFHFTAKKTFQLYDTGLEGKQTQTSSYRFEFLIPSPLPLLVSKERIEEENNNKKSQ